MIVGGRPAALLLAAVLLPPAASGCAAEGSKGNPQSRAGVSPAGSRAGSAGSAHWTALPGAPPLEASLIRRLQAAAAAKDREFPPRTRHLRGDGTPVYTNRLILESSPYLIQHAHNPVNWYPWGDEAFRIAAETGKPVLLSVGYSTCHWCHVMEEESFEDEEVARVLNEGYIAVKVDRESRPDVDAVYMAAVQAMTGGGGWPMTVWLTPDRKPFFGGTYFPARDGDDGIRTGFLTLLKRLRKAYEAGDGAVADRAGRLAAAVRAALEPAPEQAAGGDGKLPGLADLHGLAGLLESSFDGENGGLAQVPKFPGALPIRFLLRYHRRTGDARALDMAVLTLEKMAGGGIRDQVGGGFHRYATDARWLVPHFEKMLYDNALLALAYLEAYQATSRRDFARIAAAILEDADREMSAPGGGFASAIDADSPGPDGRPEEGRFYTWTPSEVEDAVGKDLAPLVTAYFGITPGGDLHGRSVLHVAMPLEKAAARAGIPPERAGALLEKARGLLGDARRKRPAPFRDGKVLTAWNGLMISAFSRAALVLEDDAYADRASAAAGYLLEHSLKGGRLLRASPGGGTAFLSDYSFFIAGLLDLYEATGSPRWLRRAMELDAVVQAHYEDAKGGGFYATPDDGEKLLAREKPVTDGAEPSGSSVEVMNLLRLYEWTTRESYRLRAERALASVKRLLPAAPASLSEMLLAADFRLGPVREIVLITPGSRREAGEFLGRLSRVFLPDRVLVVASPGRDLKEQAALVPYLEGKTALGGKTTAYVCERRVCRRPTTDPAMFEREIRGEAPPGGGEPSAAGGAEP